jgi:tRNA 2-thiouridine synthesizing protein B
MSILHTINKSPYSHSTSLSCFQVCGEHDSVLLIGDGVFGATQSSPCVGDINQLLQKGVKIYALEGDVRARGLTQKIHPEITVTDYSGFVQLSVKHSRVQSWY